MPLAWQAGVEGPTAKKEEKEEEEACMAAEPAEVPWAPGRLAEEVRSSCTVTIVVDGRKGAGQARV